MVAQTALRIIMFDSILAGRTMRFALVVQEIIEKALQVHFDYVQLADGDRHMHWQIIDDNLITISLWSKLLEARSGFTSRRPSVVCINHLTIRVRRRAGLFLSVCTVVGVCQMRIPSGVLTKGIRLLIVRSRNTPLAATAMERRKANKKVLLIAFALQEIRGESSQSRFADPNFD